MRALKLSAKLPKPHFCFNTKTIPGAKFCRSYNFVSIINGVIVYVLISVACSFIVTSSSLSFYAYFLPVALHLHPASERRPFDNRVSNLSTWEQWPMTPFTDLYLPVLYGSYMIILQSWCGGRGGGRIFPLSFFISTIDIIINVGNAQNYQFDNIRFIYFFLSYNPVSMECTCHVCWCVCIWGTSRGQWFLMGSVF